MDQRRLKELLFNCCGSISWVKNMMAFFPVEDMVELLEDAEEQWWLCSEDDWKQAFSHHPKIGNIDSLRDKFSATAEWASNEQAAVSSANEQTLLALQEGNKEYEDKFGYIFIVCATGKSAEEMLAMLKQRLQNSPEVEIEVAADEQNKITKLRLEKLLDTEYNNQT